MKLAAWRVALRIARRDALRAKGRSALVIAMIAVPILGVSAADVTFRSSQLTAQESADRRMGQAQAFITSIQPGQAVEQAVDPGNGSDDVPAKQAGSSVGGVSRTALAKEPTAQLLAQALPAGATVQPVSIDNYLATSTAYGRTTVSVNGIDLNDPLTRGMVTLRQGTLPKAPFQVAVSTAFLKDTGLSIGRTTTLANSDQPLTITAAVEFPNSLGNDELVLRPDDLASVMTGINAADAKAGNSGGGFTLGQTWLVSLPGQSAFSWNDVLKANQYGVAVASRAVLADPPPARDVPYSAHQRQFAGSSSDQTTITILGTVVGMALLEIVLLAGPAFAVGARRSRRQLGLLAAGGGNRAHTRSVVLGGGIVLGTMGAVCGIVLGSAAVALGRGWLEAKAGVRFGSLTLEPLDLLGIVLVGLVTGLLAAVVPAVQASRQDVVASLTGRGTVKAPPKVLTLLGVLALAGGAALALLGTSVAGGGFVPVLGGSALAELGVVACTPFLVGQFGRLSGRLPLGPRLALRDATRNRGRTAPAVAAVMAAVAGAVAVLVFQSSTDAQQRQAYSARAASGAVTLSADQYVDPTGKHLDQARAAVQNSIPDPGPRADLSTLLFGPGCVTGTEETCGNVSVQLPASQVCPAFAAAGPGMAGLTQAAIQQAAHADPRCQAAVNASRDLVDSIGAPVVVGDATALPNVLGIDDPAAVAALDRGSVLVTDARYVVDGRVTLQMLRYPPDGNGTPTIRTASLPATVINVHPATLTALVPASAAELAGLKTAPLASVWLPKQPVTQVEQQRAAAAVGQVSQAQLSVERGFQAQHGALAAGLVIAALAVAVAAAGIATGLAAADSQADLATLAAVGAAARIRRTLSGFQCAVIAAMGALLGAVAGMVPAAALWQELSSNQTLFYDSASGTIDGVRSGAMTVPWSTLLELVVGLPLLAWLLAAAFTRSRMVLTRRLG